RSSARAKSRGRRAGGRRPLSAAAPQPLWSHRSEQFLSGCSTPISEAELREGAHSRLRVRRREGGRSRLDLRQKSKICLARTTKCLNEFGIKINKWLGVALCGRVAYASRPDIINHIRASSIGTNHGMFDSVANGHSRDEMTRSSCAGAAASAAAPDDTVRTARAGRCCVAPRSAALGALSANDSITSQKITTIVLRLHSAWTFHKNSLTIKVYANCLERAESAQRARRERAPPPWTGYTFYGCLPDAQNFSSSYTLMPRGGAVTFASNSELELDAPRHSSSGSAEPLRAQRGPALRCQGCHLNGHVLILTIAPVAAGPSYCAAANAI
ncbi:hypothetical protein EVAR_68390_1, partial [Eumeta japonica]